MITLVAKILFVSADIILKVAVITSLLTKITFVVAERIFKVAMITSSVVKTTFLAEITLNGCNHFLCGQNHFCYG